MWIVYASLCFCYVVFVLVETGVTVSSTRVEVDHGCLRVRLPHVGRFEFTRDSVERACVVSFDEVDRWEELWVYRGGEVVCRWSMDEFGIRTIDAIADGFRIIGVPVEVPAKNRPRPVVF